MMKRKIAIIITAVIATVVGISVMVASGATDTNDASSDATGIVSGADYAKATSVATGIVGSSTSWPSTYFGGPLGNNEVLPATHGHTLLSLWSGVYGNTASQQRTMMAGRITDMGRSPDLIGFQCPNDPTNGSCMLDTSSSDLSENWIHSQGAMPFLTWEPSGTYADIAAGNSTSNAQIDDAANRFKTFGHRIMIRMFAEFNEHGAWNTSDFVSAWRYIVNRFASDGATDVGFVWCPTEKAGTSARTTIDASYPGNAYVDWVSSDSYNYDTTTDYDAGVANWNEFSWLFNYDDTHCNCTESMEQAYGPTKPFFVSETGTKYDTAGVPSGHSQDVNRKKNWYINIESAAANMPYLVGVDFFDQDVHASETGNNWRVDAKCDSAGNNCSNGATDSNTYSGFTSMAGSTQFSGGIDGGINP